MATAKKLPSGSWRCLVYDYTDSSGKRKYKSFTSNDPTPKGKREVEFQAAEYAANKADSKRYYSNMTFQEALGKYILSRTEVLSPSTIREYKRSQTRDLKILQDKKIDELTQEDIQNAINIEAKTHSPKSVRNMHGLLSAVLKEYRPNFALTTRLPQKIKPKLYIPNDSDVQRLIESVNDDEDMHIAILLAAFGPMRRSEICGLRSDDIEQQVIHVQRAVVLNNDNEWITKTTKSVAGNRFIPLPDFVYDKIKFRKGSIVNLTPAQITDRFEWVLKRAKLSHFRFHDLRHYCASIQHAMGIPDAYIMQRGGWGSDTVLKTVYRHALEDKELEMNQKANDYFKNIF